MRLTADLIKNSLAYLNPVKERELDLRGHRIPAIENLGVAGPQDAIDFTDNDIQVLGNFPLSPRIRTLLLARNRVATIQPTLPDSIPNLTNLVLASNNIAELGDLDTLGKFGRLTHLVLMDNPVARKENYRYYTIFRIPTVRFLDYQKVRDAERKAAKALFGTPDAPTELAVRIAASATGSRGSFDIAVLQNGPPKDGNAAGASKLSRIKLTDAERKRLQEKIRKADSLEEIIRLEKELNEGRLPAGVHVDGEAMEE